MKGLLNFLKDNFTFCGIKREMSNEYVKLYNTSQDRFKQNLAYYDGNIKRFSTMIRYSQDDGKTLKEIDCILWNINEINTDNLFVSTDLGISFCRNPETAKYYINKINEEYKKREEFIRKNTTSETPYNIMYEMIDERHGLYNDKGFPFIDIRSKECIEEIKRAFRNKKFRIIRDFIIIVCGLLGSLASILSIVLYFATKH